MKSTAACSAARGHEREVCVHKIDSAKPTTDERHNGFLDSNNHALQVGAPTAATRPPRSPTRKLATTAVHA